MKNSWLVVLQPPEQAVFLKLSNSRIRKPNPFKLGMELHHSFIYFHF